MTATTPAACAAAPRSLAGKTAWSALSVLALTASRFVAGIIAARTLGPALSGQMIYVLWLADSFSLVAGLGLHSSVVRFTAELDSQGRHAEAHALLRWAMIRYGGQLSYDVEPARWIAFGQAMAAAIPLYLLALYRVREVKLNG